MIVRRKNSRTDLALGRSSIGFCTNQNQGHGVVISAPSRNGKDIEVTLNSSDCEEIIKAYKEYLNAPA